MNRLTLAAAALLAAGCIPQSIDLSGKDCDAEGACAEGFACVQDKCVEADGLEGRECLAGETAACGLEIGACRPGLRSCQPDGKLGACAGAVPPAEELCDGLDNDCDGTTDEGLDGDRDGYGPEGVAGCPNAGVDCDDADAARFPGAAESCNGLDDDCDAATDEGLDEDRDGYGREGASGCAWPGVDCDDQAAAVHPGASELCNGLDDDCSGAADELFACTAGTAGGECAYSGPACTVASTEHCSATCAPVCEPPVEQCNGVDDDCDGQLDAILGLQATQTSLTAGSLRPAITGLSSGGFLAAWEEPNPTNLQRRSVRLAQLSAAGELLAAATASADSTKPLQPAVLESMAVWLEPHGGSLRVHAAPLALGAGAIAVSASLAVSSQSIELDGDSPLALGTVGGLPAVLWREKTGAVSLQRLTAAGAASGSVLPIGTGSQPAFALDESLSPARATVVLLNGGSMTAQRLNEAGTGLALSSQFGSGVLGFAAAGGAIARVERTASNDLVILRRLAGGGADTVVASLPVGQTTGIALGRVGASESWLVAWTQLRASSGEEVVAARATWTASSWQVGATAAVDPREASSAVGAGDAALPAVAFVRDSQVFVRLLCP